jgi:hypothetical protein
MAKRQPQRSDAPTPPPSTPQPPAASTPAAVQDPPAADPAAGSDGAPTSAPPSPAVGTSPPDAPVTAAEQPVGAGGPARVDTNTDDGDPPHDDEGEAAAGGAGLLPPVGSGAEAGVEPEHEYQRVGNAAYKAALAEGKGEQEAQRLAIEAAAKVPGSPYAPRGAAPAEAEPQVVNTGPTAKVMRGPLPKHPPNEAVQDPVALSDAPEALSPCCNRPSGKVDSRHRQCGLCGNTYAVQPEAPAAVAG